MTLVGSVDTAQVNIGLSNGQVKVVATDKDVFLAWEQVGVGIEQDVVPLIFVGSQQRTCALFFCTV